jgi:hypothetical protein
MNDFCSSIRCFICISALVAEECLSDILLIVGNFQGSMLFYSSLFGLACLFACVQVMSTQIVVLFAHHDHAQIYMSGVL